MSGKNMFHAMLIKSQHARKFSELFFPFRIMLITLITKSVLYFFFYICQALSAKHRRPPPSQEVEITEAEPSRTPEDSVCSVEGPTDTGTGNEMSGISVSKQHQAYQVTHLQESLPQTNINNNTMATNHAFIDVLVHL